MTTHDIDRENEAENDEFGIGRRSVLKSAALLGTVGVFGIPAFSGGVAASSHVTETIYISHSVSPEPTRNCTA